MDEVLTRLVQEIDVRLGCAYCRIYLVDRDSDELVPQTLPGMNDQIQIVESQYTPGQGSIVYKAKETRHPVSLSDITHRSGVLPLNSEAHSALALPLMINTRVVGVVEVQSPLPNAFQENEMKLLFGLCNSMTQMVEDAWLLESGWLMQQTRDALRHLWADLYLGRSPLAAWALSSHDVLMEYTPVKRGEALRQLLLATIEGLNSPNNETHDVSSQRGYSILKLTYVEEYVVDEIARKLNISRRQYFYDLKAALETLADALVRKHQANL